MNPMIKLTRRHKSEIGNATTFNKSFYLAGCTKYTFVSLEDSKVATGGDL